VKREKWTVVEYYIPMVENWISGSTIRRPQPITLPALSNDSVIVSVSFDVKSAHWQRNKNK